MLPEVGGRQAHEHPDGGGFAGAVGAQESEEAPARDLQVQAVHGGLGPVHLTEIADRNRRSREHAESVPWYKRPEV